MSNLIGIRLVGYEDICYKHKKRKCICVPLPCANCYSYGPDFCKHQFWGYASYKDIKKAKCHWTVKKYKLSWELFEWIYPGTLEETNHDLFYIYQDVMRELVYKSKSSRIN